MDREPRIISPTRRNVLKLGGAALAAGVSGATVDLLTPRTGDAQAPKRGGVFRLPLAQPPMFDHQLTVNWSTQIVVSFTHSRLVKVKAGPSVTPGTFPLEPDVAESWSQPTETTYVFKLRRGVRWHPKPPVNGRELTAEDVKYTYERFLTVPGNPNRAQLEEVDKIEALDRYTVKFSLKEPYAWLLDALATPSMCIIAKEVVEQYGDLKKSEACIGTGPWMLERYESGARMTWVRHPYYFLPGLPYADQVEGRVHPDPSSRLASWLAGGYDFGPEYLNVVRRADLDIVRQRKPALKTAEFLSPVGGVAVPKLGQEPFKDVRVRRAMMRANNWKEILESNAVAEGHGAPNPAVPAALREWAIPIDQLPPDGRKLYEQDPADAKRLLAAAGYPNGFKVPLETSGGFGLDFMDAVQIVQRNWKAIGIESDLKLKEVGAFVSSSIYGRFDKLMMMIRGGLVYPDPYLVHQYMPGQPLNAAGVDDPKLSEMIRLQRRTFDVSKRREILYDIQRYLSETVYYLLVGPSAMVVSAWEPYVKNFAPNLGNDYGGRLVAAWLDR
jgi:peptide/nickel transport system substrate-binding protein